MKIIFYTTKRTIAVKFNSENQILVNILGNLNVSQIYKANDSACKPTSTLVYKFFNESVRLQTKTTTRFVPRDEQFFDHYRGENRFGTLGTLNMWQTHRHNRRMFPGNDPKSATAKHLLGKHRSDNLFVSSITPTLYNR